MNLAKNTGFKTKFSDFLLWTGIIVSIVALIIQFVTSIIGYKAIPSGATNVHHLWTPNSAWVGIWTMLSFFTVQSNILVLLFFCLLLSNRFHEDRFLFVHGRFCLAVTTYITITMTVFYGVLFIPMLNNFNKDSISIIDFGNTFLLHLIVPVIMILYFIITSGKYYWGYKKQAYLWTPIISIYLFVYLGYALVKGNFVGKLIKDKAEIDYSFPYPFLNFHDNLTNFLIAIFTILALYILLMALFTLYNNMIYKRINKSLSVLRNNNV